MKYLVIAFAVLLSSCGSGSSTPLQNDEAANQLNVTQLLNGSSRQSATSFWQCNAVLNNAQQSLVFQAFGNGTGNSSAAGDFTWLATDDEIELTIGDDLSFVFDIFHDEARNNVLFKEFLGIGQIRQYQCGRQSFST